MRPDPEQEANELHQLPVGRPIALALVLSFLLLITVRPLLLLRSEGVRQIFATFFAGLAEAPRESRDPWKVNEALHQAIREFDEDIEKNSRFSERLLPVWHQAMAQLGIGHETVHVGRDGWLEYRPALEYVTGVPVLEPARLAARRIADPRPALLRLKADLDLRGIALWLMPAPSKVMVHPEGFAAGAVDEGELDNPSFAQLKSDLEAAGIRVFETLPLLRAEAKKQRVFFKTDSHWNPVGIDRAAAALAAALEAELPLGPRDRDWRRKIDTLRYPGDLARMLHLEKSPLFPPETIEVAMVTDARGRLWKPEAGAQVLLLGDSYANIFSPRAGSLPAQLAYYLGRGVDRLVMDGGGAFGTREALDRESRQNPHRLSTTRVVVLELAVRELAVSRWKVIPLRKPPVGPGPVAPESPPGSAP